MGYLYRFYDEIVWGSLYKLYDWMFPFTYTKDINRELDGAIKFAETGVQDKSITEEQVVASLKYLRRADVRKQAIDYCAQLEPVRIWTRWQRKDGTAYVEMILTTNKERDDHVINYWPCEGLVRVTCNPMR